MCPDSSLAAAPGTGPGTQPAGGKPTGSSGAATAKPAVDATPIPPTVGRDVHHVGGGVTDGHYVPELRPAKITKAGGGEGAEYGAVSLVVWTTSGQFWADEVPYHGGIDDDEPEFSPYYRCPLSGLAFPVDTWHWPPRV